MYVYILTFFSHLGKNYIWRLNPPQTQHAQLQQWICARRLKCAFPHSSVSRWQIPVFAKTPYIDKRSDRGKSGKFALRKTAIFILLMRKTQLH